MLAGRQVLILGAGISGQSVWRYARRCGASAMLATDQVVTNPLPDAEYLTGATELPSGVDLVVTSPGFRPSHRLLTAAAAAGVEVIGDVELAARIDAAAHPDRPWLVVTGTNGKTTTTAMAESILRSAGLAVTACGNIGTPIVDIACADQAPVVLAELSSFQLHYAPSLRPRAGALLNLAEDHLDWHGSMAAYAAAKARALTGQVAIAVTDDKNAAQLLAASPAPVTVAVTGRRPGAGQLGVIDGRAVDLAFGAGELFDVEVVRPPGAHNLTNALAAAALVLSAGISAVTAQAVQAGITSFVPGGHRNVLVAERGGVRYVDDSKATNPHAASASLAAYDSVIWIAGGQLKGARVDELLREHAARLAGIVLLGADAELIEDCCRQHAPDVRRIRVAGSDDRTMEAVVQAAAGMARPGDTVLLAPAAASLDMFTSYAARGQAFADAVGGLGEVGI